MYSINFTENNKKFCLSLHNNGAYSYLLVNGTEIHKFKAKGSFIMFSVFKATPSCSGNNSKGWSVEDMKNTGLNGYIYNFRIDYDAIAVADILDIRKYSMKKWDSIMFEFVKQIFVSAMVCFSCNSSNVNPLKCVSMSNKEC